MIKPLGRGAAGVVVAKPVTASPLVLDVEGACATLSLSRTAVYDLLARRELVRVKIGRRTLIPIASIEALINRSTQG